jgi:Flp pilus assembly protein protease CpaA
MTSSINFLFLFPLAVIGLICSYTDIKYGKIFNKWISLGFLYVLLLYLFLFSYNFSAGDEENIRYLLRLSANGFTALLGGYVLWHFKLWSAGDAKLFAVYSFLIPLSFYSKSHIILFPSFNLLINLFIPLLFILMGNRLLVLVKNGYSQRQRIKELVSLARKNVLKTTLFLFQAFLNYVFVLIALRLLIFLIESGPWSEILLNPFFIFGLLLLVMGRFSTLRRKKRWLDFIVYGTILSYGGLLVLQGQIYLLGNILKIALIFMILMGSIRQLLGSYAREREMRWGKIKDIGKGTILPKNEFYIISKKLKAKKMEREFGEIGASGLNENQADIIKRLFTSDRGIRIMKQKTIPLAPFLFLSAIISVSTESSFLPLIANFFHSLI